MDEQVPITGGQRDVADLLLADGETVGAASPRPPTSSVGLSPQSVVDRAHKLGELFRSLAVNVVSTVDLDQFDTIDQ